MGIYFKTARNAADNNERQSMKADPVYFSNHGWHEFALWLVGEAPQIKDIIDRYNGPVDGHPVHNQLTCDGRPLDLSFTVEDCRRLFAALAAVSEEGQRKEYDFWQFAVLVSSGIIEDGLISY
ncbi:hypothetical protein G6L37_00225 [Agrobacterium rubi]|nr:hypothetical protein [Agrobacterium rubi]NTF23676.1 hypothetical protein [Agrobacterium rubi]